MSGFDDVSSLFLLENSGVQRHGVGQIVQWNSDTFENVVWWNGTAVTNMKIGNPIDALSYAPGMWVSITVIDASGAEGVAQAFISGRIIDPGEDAAAQAVAFLRTTFAREIAAEVFADRIASDFDAFPAERTSNVWGDPTNGADPGPQVTVNVSSTGKALVLIGCQTIASSLDTASAFGYQGGRIGFSVSGATTADPDVNQIVQTTVFKYRGSGVTLIDGVRVSTTPSIAFPVTVNPGDNTFTMKYQRSGAADLVYADNRSITVIAF